MPLDAHDSRTHTAGCEGRSTVPRKTTTTEVAMLITAKFASSCPCCRQPIQVGSKIEWSKGSPARHVACATGASTVSAARPARRQYASRGRWNGCSCGARELPEGGLSANACASCRFDEYDC